MLISITFDAGLKRSAIRDIPIYGQQFLQMYISKYIPIQKKYIAQHKPQQYCEMLIDNNDLHRPSILY